METLMTLNEFITEIVKYELIKYVQDNIYDNYPDEEFDHENNNYIENDYEIHLHYLIEKWKKSIDESLVGNFRIDYNTQGTFNELWKYAVELRIVPWLHDRWLDDILHTNITLK